MRLPTGPLARLLVVWLLIGVAGWAYTVALAVYAFRTSGATGVGVYMAARLLPAVFAAPLSGGLIDRGDRARVVVKACSIQTACVGGAAALVLAGAHLAPVIVLAAISRTTATAPRPALQALTPALARTPEELTRSTSIWGAIDNFGFLLGAGVGGVAVAATGPGAIVAGAAVTFGLAVPLAAGLPSVTAAAPDPDQSKPEGFAPALAGLHVLAQTPLLRAPFALFAGALLLEGTTDVQLAVLSLGKLALGNGGLGVLYVCWGAGGILSSAALVKLVRCRGYGLALAVGAFAFAAGIAFAGADGVALALVAMVSAGVGFGLLETAVMGLVPRLADDAIVGRVYALVEILYAGVAGLGALIAPGLIAAFGIAGSLAAVGASFAVAAALTWHSYQRLDHGQGEAARVRELLRGIGFLKSLPLPQLERLVRSADALAFPSGTIVVRRGEIGDQFYVIESGTVEIVEHGRRQGPGEGFGEIALLRDVPRTATVRALTDLRLWAVARPGFVAAVSRHGDTSQLADAVVVEHLAKKPTA